MGVATSSPYGFCPTCGDRGATRERRPNGYDTCVNGHKYLTASALPSKPDLAGAARPAPAMIPLKMTKPPEGPVAFCIAGHSKAEELAEQVCALRGPNDQGVVVIPYAASASNFMGRDAIPFRAVIIVPPNANQAVDRISFDRWIEVSIMPHAAPGAPKVIL